MKVVPNIRILPTDLMLYFLGATDHVGWQELWESVPDEDQAMTIARCAHMGYITKDGMHFTNWGEVILEKVSELLERRDVL